MGVQGTDEAVGTTLKIKNVSTDKPSFRPSANETVDIVFHLTEHAVVDVNLHDCRDMLVRRVVKGRSFGAGDQRAVWDGRDEGGRAVPPGVYTYTIAGADKQGRRVTHDLTDMTGGDQQWAEGIRYNAKSKAISYVLPKAGRVNIRLGIQEGPLLRTLIDWPVRDAGLQVEPWDGYDNSGVLKFDENPKLDIAVWSYQLSGNSIIVAGKDRQVRPKMIEDVSWDKVYRERTAPKKSELFNHWQHPRAACRDPRIFLKVIGVEHRKDGVPIIDGETYFQMTIDLQDQKIMVDQKFEVVYYVDGVFIYEEELGYTPFSWRWNPAGVNAGIHYITVVLRGYQGHFGSATKKVWVRRIKE